MLHSRYRWPGGEESTVERLVEMLTRAGHEVNLYEIENPTGTLQSATAAMAAPWNHAQYRSVLRIIDRFRPDVAHVHNTWFSLSPAVILACTKREVPVVTTVHNYRTVCPQAQLFRDNEACTDCVGRFPAPALRHRCYRGSVTLTAVSISTTALHKRLGTWNALQVVHVPSAFSRSIIESGPLRNSPFLVFPNASSDPGSRPSPPSASNEALFVGRLAPEKGLDLVLDAWEQYRPRGLHLSVIGDGPERQAWEMRQIDGVTFHGHRKPDEVRTAMLKARVLLFPSRSYEVCPMVVVEALSAGLPIFAHDLGATPELLPGNQGQSFVPVNDPTGWGRALDFVSDDQMVDRLGDENRHAYLQHHTMSQWLANHETLYQTALVG